NKLSSGQLKVAATGFLSLFSIVGIMVYGLPFFYDFWVKEYGWSRATVTSGNAFAKVAVGLLGFFAGWFIDRFGPRRLMLAGILMGGIALIGLSTVTTLWQFYLFYIFSALGYMCAGPLPNQVLTARWFNKTRGKAMGFAYLGIGVGGMLVPQIAKLLNIQFGWHQALMLLGILMVIISFPMAWIVKENPELRSIETISEEATIPLNRIVKGWTFCLLLIGSMCSIGAVAGTSQNLKLFFSLDLKYSQGQSANIISLVLLSSIIGRVLMGWLADKFPKKYVMILIYTLVAGSIPLLYFASTPGVIYLFAFIFGIGLGGDYMIIPLMAAELFGVRIMGRVMGLVLTADGLAEAFSPMLVAKLRDASANYANGFAVLIILAIIGIIAVAMLPKKATTQKN
ncbi:MAG TPA: MFS transporter, partial [Chitinophagaceae bacterium]|nr:MFS transporter [Chitinophagaceae bacterium]